MPTMPNGLKPVVAGYSMDEPGGVMRTEVAGGAARYGLDWDRGPQRFSVTIIMDALQFSVWQAFYFYSIDKGALAFDMPLDSGFGVSAHSVNIVPGSYGAARTGGVMMVVTFSAEANTQAYALTNIQATDMAGLFNVYGIRPIVAGYSMDDAGGVLRTEVSGGAARYALDYDRGTQRFSVTLLLSAEQFAVWTVYYARIIAKGSKTFDMPLDSGFGVSPHPVNIMPGSYNSARTGGVLWSVSFAVEAEPQVYALGPDGAASMVAVYGLYGRESDALLARIAKFATVDVNVLAFP